MLQSPFKFKAGECTVNGFYTLCWVETDNNEFRYLDSSGNVQTLMGNYPRWGGRDSSGYVGGSQYGSGWSAQLNGLNYPVGFTQNPVDGSFQVSSLMSNVIVSTYTPTNTTLTVNKSGAGTVTSSDGTINCGSTCSASYVPGTHVQLTATPAPGNSFAGYTVTGWGSCGASTTCHLGMPMDTQVIAPFISGSSVSVTQQITGTVRETGAVRH